MHTASAVFRREFLGYFRTPVAYVFLIAFLLTATALTFFGGRLFDSGTASLEPFFIWIPWIYVLFIPAIGMRLWAEERRSGSLELLFTLPISPAAAVLAKFLAAWSFIAVALAGTLTLPLTVSWLGEPDWGVIASGYLGAFLMAGAYLAICSVISSLTRSQVIAFVISALVCLVLVLLGWDFFSGLLAQAFPVWVVDAIAGFSFVTHYDTLLRGIVDLRAVAFFGSLIAFGLVVNALAIER